MSAFIGARRGVEQERRRVGAGRFGRRGAARGVQGVFSIHQHGGEGRSAHPHVHALLSPRLQNRAPTHRSPRAIQAVRER
jgi:hypothetical protein